MGSKLREMRKRRRRREIPAVEHMYSQLVSDLADSCTRTARLQTISAMNCGQNGAGTAPCGCWKLCTRGVARNSLFRCHNSLQHSGQHIGTNSQCATTKGHCIGTSSQHITTIVYSCHLLNTQRKNSENDCQGM